MPQTQNSVEVVGGAIVRGDAVKLWLN